MQKITRMAFEACANYGMNNVIGPVSYGGTEGSKESWQKPFSEKTGEMLDAEVRKMIMCVAIIMGSCQVVQFTDLIVDNIGPLMSVPATCSQSTAMTWRRSLSYF